MRARAGLLLAALAVALRLGWVLAVPTHPVGDFAMYWESAGYVVEHHALDPEFIYMPGYVLLLAGVRALGGGLLAGKLLGVAAGGIATGAAYGIARRVLSPAAAVIAGLLCALWPAGVAVASVTGTDMPAAALLVAAAYLLVRDAPARPARAAVLFGAVLGLAAYVRAVALPLGALAALHWWALRATARQVVARTALGCAVAFLVLLPWGIRNRVHYGEFFLTDSHGGHTALVGANPNSEGTYSRSLNLMFRLGTGYALFDPPHRASDRAAYALARQWTAFEPAYAVGLLAAKADRLLSHERPLLYWPIYRQGVLPESASSTRWLNAHRPGLETLTDGFWYAVIAAAALGVVIAFCRRRWAALSLLPLPLALAALYASFFAEVRYHLAIVVFLFPYAGEGVRWTVEAARAVARRGLPAAERRRVGREALLGALAVACLLLGWPRLVAAGDGLRARHRWAVCVCRLVGGRPRLALWRATVPPSGSARSPVRGVWNGLGLALDGPVAAAATDVDLPPGRYRISARVERGDAGVTGRVALRANGSVLTSALFPSTNHPEILGGAVNHAGGSLHIEAVAERLGTPPVAAGAFAIWIADLTIEGELR